MHRTLKETTANPPMRNGKVQQKAFDAFVHEYNYQRPNEALGQKPPAAAYQKSCWHYPRTQSRISYPYNAVLRKVNRNGEIKWKRKSIFISKALIGEYIELKQKEEQLWQIWFMHCPLGIVNVATKKLLPMCPD